VQGFGLEGPCTIESAATLADDATPRQCNFELADSARWHRRPHASGAVAHMVRPYNAFLVIATCIAAACAPNRNTSGSVPATLIGLGFKALA